MLRLITTETNGPDDFTTSGPLAFAGVMAAALTWGRAVRDALHGQKDCDTDYCQGTAVHQGADYVHGFC